MRTIHKYPLKVVDRQSFYVTKCFYPLSVKFQKGDLHLWGETEDTLPRDTLLEIAIIGTGNAMPKNSPDYYWRHLGTVMDGRFVWHIYYKHHMALP
jgi:hypothetical protein